MGRCPMLVWAGPLALNMTASLALIYLAEAVMKSGLMTDLLTGRVRVPATVELVSASANGATSNQPGATPQVSGRKHHKG